MYADDVAVMVKRILKRELGRTFPLELHTVERPGRPPRVYVRVRVPRNVALPLVLYENAHACGYVIE